MGRKVSFQERDFTLYLTGLTSLLALKRKVTISYDDIRKVVVDYFDPPFWMWRLPGTSVPFLPIYEGSFYAHAWYFLSYEQKVPLVHIELDGGLKYRHVIFETADPEQIAKEIRNRVAKANEQA